MALLGTLFRRVRAGEHRSPLSHSGFDASKSIVVTSASFADGGPMPQSSAGKGVGTNTSPALQWAGVPAERRQLVLIIDDVAVPLPRPLFHTIAVIEPTVNGVAAVAARPGAGRCRLSPEPAGGGGGELGRDTEGS